MFSARTSSAWSIQARRFCANVKRGLLVRSIAVSALREREAEAAGGDDGRVLLKRA
jgi:hypothetical protein